MVLTSTITYFLASLSWHVAVVLATIGMGQQHT